MILKGVAGKLEITILKRSNSDTDDYWDGNWLEAEIKIVLPGIKILYGTNLRVDDLQRFYENVIALKYNRSKEAEFTTMEEGIYLHLDFEPNGAVRCKGKANSESGNSLDFKIQTELALLDVFIDELRIALESYPLVGSLE
jgi:hypothetical protein